jgi:chaperonin GroES
LSADSTVVSPTNENVGVWHTREPTPSFMTNIKIRPIGDRILIKYVDENKEQIRGGIIIPDSSKEKPQEAHVVSLGTGKKEKDGKVTPFEVKVGDKILVSKYGIAEVQINEIKYNLAREEDILAVLT